MHVEDTLPDSIRGPVEEADLTAGAWLQHAREEAADLSVYLTRVQASHNRIAAELLELIANAGDPMVTVSLANRLIAFLMASPAPEAQAAIVPGVYRRVNSDMLVLLDENGTVMLAMFCSRMFDKGSAEYMKHGFDNVTAKRHHNRFHIVTLAGYEYYLHATMSNFLADEAQRISDAH